MSQKAEGGKKVAAKMLARDPDFYKKIGALGGAAKWPTKGFGGDKQRASNAGKKGGIVRLRKNREI